MSAFALVCTACQTDGAKTDGEDATGTGQTEQPKKVGKKIRTESDSLSYAVGIDLGNHLKNNIKAQVGDDLNNEMVFAAIKDVFSDKGTLTMDESYNFLNEYFSIRIPEKKKAEGKKFLEEVEKKNPNIKKTESGMLYEIIEQGSDVRATDLRDQVRVA